nr:MAG TPA_asm: hypothetical protein [Caudoviricetes sp.]
MAPAPLCSLSAKYSGPLEEKVKTVPICFQAPSETELYACDKFVLTPFNPP